MAALRWLSVDATGAVVAYLPGLSADGPLRRTMGRYESQTATLVVDASTDESWSAATTPFESALIAYETPGVVVWGGIVVTRQRDLSNLVKLSLVTPEGYLDRRYVGDYSQTGRDQNVILTDLRSLFAGAHAAVPGSVGWSFIHAFIGAPVVTRDRSYLNTDDKSVYSAMQELAGVKGGPQWHTGWRWTHGPENIQPLLTVGTRIGARQPPGMAPAVTFTTEMLTSFSSVEDYSSGKGANLLTAVSSGQGGTRPSASASVLQPRRPVVEHRWTPSTSITNPAVLQGHADSNLPRMRDGARIVSFTVSRAAAPQVGVDWDLGDDVGYSVSSPSLGLTPEQVPGAAAPIPRTIPYTIGAPMVTVWRQSRVTGVGQVIGYDVGVDTVTPYIAQEGG